MLLKENRLKKTKDFENVWKMGKSRRENCLLLKTAKNNLAETRFAFVVGTKVAKKAVVRNKIKRRLRAIIRKKMPQIKPGVDVILNALPGIETKNFRALQEMLNNLLSKAGLFKIKNDKFQITNVKSITKSK